MTTTTPSITGHLRTVKTVTVAACSPIRLPTTSASGPLTTSPTRTRPAITTRPRVMRTCCGRSFQTGRPSGTW